MRLSRADFAPLLAIVAGGVIGGSLSFSFLGSRSSDDVRVGTVIGQVTDAQTGVSLGAVQVYIDDLRLGALSKRDGRYLLLNVPAGTHTLTVARMGYRTVEEQITIGGGQTVEQNFSVAEEAIQLDEVAVVVPTPCLTRVRVIGGASVPEPSKILVVVDGVGFYFSGACEWNWDDIETFEPILGPLGRARFGEEGGRGAIVITLKEGRDAVATVGEYPDSPQRGSRRRP